MSAIRSPSLRHGPSIGALGMAVMLATLPAPVLAAVHVEPPPPVQRATPVQPAPTVQPAPPVQPAPTVQPESPPAPEHETLIADGNRLVANGKPAEGAEKLSTAYVLMPPSLRVGSEGRFVVSLACNAYEAAWQSTHDGAHLEANQVLLAAYFADLDAARAAGGAAVAADAQEQALRDRQEGIEQVLAELHASASPVDPAVIAPAEGDASAIEPQQELTFPPPDPRIRRNAVILVAAGATGVLAGTIMVIAGARAAARAEEARRTMAVADAGDARSTKVAGTIVATTGALLASGSVMILGVGSGRLRRSRSDVALTLQPTLGGVVLRGRF